MKIEIKRGANTIGGSSVELSSQGKRIIIDLGLPLDAEANSLDLLPEIQGLDGSAPDLLGILISHGHMDHYGLMKHVSSKIPLGMGAASHNVINRVAKYIPDGFMLPNLTWGFQNRQPFEIGPFTITPYLVDHSGYDAYALRIEADNKSVFYSGDFRAHGRKSKLFDHFVSSSPKTVDALLLEGSSLGRLDINAQFASETEIEKDLVIEFTKSTGLALVHTSGQNIDRIVSIYRAAKRTGRSLIIDSYIAEVFDAIGNANLPGLNFPDVRLFVPKLQQIQIKKSQDFAFLDKHKSSRIYLEEISSSPEKFTLLFRPLHMREFPSNGDLPNATFIYSQWDGYFDDGGYDRVKNWLSSHNIDPIQIHTSGHASPNDLQRLAESLQPKKVIPIHSFMPELYENLFDNVEVVPNGTPIEI